MARVVQDEDFGHAYFFVVRRDGALTVRLARRARILGLRALTVQGMLVTVDSIFTADAPLTSVPLPKNLLAACLLACVAFVAGCAGAPVQEMSNARQAVRAAEKAGAAEAAPELLGEARVALRSAESHLRQGEYRTARDEAEQARTKAVEARRVAESERQPAGT
jgi:hypothetical protein